MWDIERVYSLLEQNNKEARELAFHIGVTPSTLSEWRAGRLKAPSIDKVEKIADFFNISLDELIGRDILPTDEKGKQLLENFKAASPSVQEAVLKALRPDIEPKED